MAQEGIARSPSAAVPSRDKKDVKGALYAGVHSASSAREGVPGLGVSLKGAGHSVEK